jgi:hypothetical protein
MTPDWNKRHPDPFGVKSRDEETISRGHPPVAHKVVLVDFDGTMFPFGNLDDESVRPFPWTVASVKALRDHGYRIVVFTSRLSRRWWVSEVGEEQADIFGEKQLAYVTQMLAKNDIPFDEITAEKIPAEAYFDDKAWRINAYMTLRECVIAFLASNGHLKRKGDINW